MFKDLVVVELASILAGPAVGMFFAELGAKVYKIENIKTDGDLTRRWKLFSEDPHYPASAYYASVNWGKEVWMMDLGEQKDLKKLYELIKKADIVISNFKTSSAIKLGIDYATLKSINPCIIFANIKGYPGNDRPAFDAILQAESGYLSMTGHVNDNKAVKMPVALIDQLAAHQLKQGILIALLNKERTGKGSFVEANLYESAIASLANQASNWLNENHVPQRMGTLHPNIAPYGEVYTSSDGISFLLAIGVDNHFEKMMKSLGLFEKIDWKNYHTNQLRLHNRSKLHMILTNKFKKLEYGAIQKLFVTNGIPFGRINTVAEVFNHQDAKNMVIKQSHHDKNMSCVKTVAFTIR